MSAREDDYCSDDYRSLARRPGYLIRRLHQIHLALFAEECGAFGVTPVQYSIMTVVARQPALDQGHLAEEVGVDRATLADVLARLEARGLVSRRRPGADRRMKLVSITAAGRQLLVRMDPHARRAHERTVAALPPEARAEFVAGLLVLVEANNALGRAPMRFARPAAAGSAPQGTVRRARDPQ
jgi:MarR family transcriptional regulator, lower aerobic nicotinate degradation pathway regulator